MYCSTEIILLAFGCVMIVTGGDDYLVGPYSITLSAGGTHASFDVAIIDDSVLESEESFTLAIDPSSLHSVVTAGDSNSATITIMDDEG